MFIKRLTSQTASLALNYFCGYMELLYVNQLQKKSELEISVLAIWFGHTQIMGHGSDSVDTGRWNEDFTA